MNKKLHLCAEASRRACGIKIGCSRNATNIFDLDLDNAIKRQNYTLASSLKLECYARLLTLNNSDLISFYINTL